MQHIYRGLKPGGRAAVVVPDNVLFEENAGAQIRSDLMEKADLHTIVRLPTGIFYAQGVKTNVLFFTRGVKATGNTKAVWVYDLRANMPSFGKRTPLGREHFAEMEKAYGSDPYGKSKRKDQGETGRFRKFTREEIKARGDNLDLAWLKDEGHRDADDLFARAGGDRGRDRRAAGDGDGRDEGAAEGARGRRVSEGEDLPAGWTRASIGSVCTLVNGRAFKPTDWTPAGLPIVRIQNLNRQDAPFNRYDGEVQHKFLIDSGELLFAWSGTPGTSFGAHIWDRGPAILNQHIFRVAFDERLFEKPFLKYAINDKLDHLVGVAHGGAGLAHVTKPVLEQTEIVVPPRSEQRRIVAKLEDLLARSKRAKEALDAIPPQLETLRRSILAAAFRGDLTAEWREKYPDVEPADRLLARIRVERRKKWEEAELARLRAKGKAPTDDRWKEKYREPEPVDASGLPELPEGWAWAGLSELAELQLGQRRAPEFAHLPPRPYIRAANITWRGLDLSDVKSMGFAEPERLILKRGDVLLSEASGSASEVGKPALWADDIADCCFQATVLRVRSCSNLADGDWLYLAFLRDALLGNFAAMAPGIGILHLTAERMRAWPVPVAPLEEQPHLLRAARSAMARAYAIADIASHVSRRGADLDAALLAKAFRGELVPQDPNDEPADVMLARLAAEQAAPAPAAKPSRGKAGPKTPAGKTRLR